MGVAGEEEATQAKVNNVPTVASQRAPPPLRKKVSSSSPWRPPGWARDELIAGGRAWWWWGAETTPPPGPPLKYAFYRPHLKVTYLVRCNDCSRTHAGHLLISLSLKPSPSALLFILPHPTQPQFCPLFALFSG